MPVGVHLGAKIAKKWGALKNPGGLGQRLPAKGFETPQIFLKPLQVFLKSLQNLLEPHQNLLKPYQNLLKPLHSLENTNLAPQQTDNWVKTRSDQ